MFFFACFFLFSQLHSPLCAFKKEINNLKKHYKNFKDINSNSLLQSFCALFTSRKRHSSVAQNLSQSTCRSTIGERTTRYSLNNSIAGCTAQTYPLLFPMLERLIVVFQSVPNFSFPFLKKEKQKRNGLEKEQLFGLRGLE